VTINTCSRKTGSTPQFMNTRQAGWRKVKKQESRVQGSKVSGEKNEAEKYSGERIKGSKTKK
jgi:hypothetical protein